MMSIPILARKRGLDVAGNSWIVRPAKRKQSAAAPGPSSSGPALSIPVSVFIFERPLSEAVEKTFGGALQSIGVGRASVGGASDKKVPEGVLEAMRRDAHQLAKLKHPSMLDVIEGLGEYRMGMAFGTESVQATIGNIIRRKFLSPDAASYELDDLEIQKGLLTVAKGLEFLQKARIVHGNLTPQALFLTSKGEWKIAGFNYTIQISTDSTCAKPSDWHAEHRLDSNETTDKPNLDFVAPEVILDEQCSYSSDMYSLGCLIYALYNEGRSPVQSHGSVRSWKQLVQSVDRTDLSKLPGPLQQCVSRMLTRSPSRITPTEFIESGYFQNLLISTLQFLEDFISKSQLHKAQFLKGLVKVLPSFSKKMQTTKLLSPPDIVTILYSAIEHPVLMVQNQALKVIPSLLDALDYNTIKNSLDKFVISTKLLPLLRENRVREPGVIMASLPLYVECGNIADKEIVATEVIPELWKLAIDPVLEVSQFKGYMTVIKDLGTKLEETHLKQLEEMRGPEMAGYGANKQAAGLEMPIVNVNPTNDDITTFESLLQLSPENGVGLHLSNKMPNVLSESALPLAFGVGIPAPKGSSPSALPESPQFGKNDLLSSVNLDGVSPGMFRSSAFTTPSVSTMSPPSTSRSSSAEPQFSANFAGFSSSPSPKQTSGVSRTLAGMQFDMTNGINVRPSAPGPIFQSPPNFNYRHSLGDNAGLGSILSGPGRPSPFVSTSPTPLYSSTPNYGGGPLTTPQRPLGPSPISPIGQQLLGISGSQQPTQGIGSGFGWSPQGQSQGFVSAGRGIMQPMQPTQPTQVGPTGISARSSLNQFDPFA
ncbi:hypothetical protein HDU93_009179 [Gonapodya sp. JEL0774]|nr:hypothetical protein HDU93_009179 [Gonapodya sp. JEL0774]